MALRARGHEVYVVCVDADSRGAIDGRLAWWDEEIAGLPVRRLQFDLATAPEPMRWEYDNPLIGAHLRTYFHAIKPDLFHLYGGYLITARPLIVARELHIPTAVSLTEFWFLCRRFTMLRSNSELSTLPLDAATCAQCIGEERPGYRLMGQVAPKVMRRYWHLRHDLVKLYQDRKIFLLDALQQATVIVSQSKFVGDMFVQAGIPAERMHFCRQGQASPSLPVEESTKDSAPVLRLGYIGQIAWHKGVHVLAEAVRCLSRTDVELHVYGNLKQDPQYTTTLLQSINRDPRITLHGAFEHERINDVYRNVDVLVVPSLWYENSPNVIFEAFMHRTPVVASDLGGMAELVCHGRNGLLFQAGNAKDLQTKLEQLLVDPKLVAQLRSGIDAVKSLEQEMDELEAIYQTAVAAEYLDKMSSMVTTDDRSSDRQRHDSQESAKWSIQHG